MSTRATHLPFALSIALSACVGALSETDRPCPCAEGWHCCSSNVCVSPAASCPASDLGDAMASASEAGPGLIGLGATPEAGPGLISLGATPEAGAGATDLDDDDADENATVFLDADNTDNNSGLYCPFVAALSGFGSVSDAASVLVGRWVACGGEGYGGTIADLGGSGTLGFEFAAATAGGGSCEAVTPDGMACAGGLVYYLVASADSTRLVRGQGSAYQNSYAVLDNGSPGLELAWGATVTGSLWFGPVGPYTNAQLLVLQADSNDFVSLVPMSFFDVTDGAPSSDGAPSFFDAMDGGGPDAN